MNIKRYKILNKCAEKLQKTVKNLEYYRLSMSDFNSICQVCKYFTSHLDDDEVFIGIKNVADWFRKIGGFSVEEEFSTEENMSMYHIFIEDKENAVANL